MVGSQPLRELSAEPMSVGGHPFPASTPAPGAAQKGNGPVIILKNASQR